MIFRIVGQSLSQIPRSYDDHSVLPVQSEDRIDLLVETFDIVSVPLLTETAEII